MQIYLLRHGIAEDAKAGQSDADRALTSEGRDKLRRVLKRARAADVSPSLILSSPYRRARQSAKVAADLLGYMGPVLTSDALTPDADSRAVWEEVRVHQSDDTAAELYLHGQVDVVRLLDAIDKFMESARVADAHGRR